MIIGSQAAALLDVFPVLRVLPDFLLPSRVQARKLHAVEKKLYLDHWLTAKRAIQDGTAKVRLILLFYSLLIP